MADDVIRAGLIGCGNISATYFRLCPLFRFVEITACADLHRPAAEARADEFGVRAGNVDELLSDSSLDLIINLTIPAAHYQISKRAILAGKHVYSEKPMVLSLSEGHELLRHAKERSLKVGCAPDTFLGGAHQWVRAQLDDGAIGQIHSGTCYVLSAGMEHWHPNPDFFYQKGGGPILDLGPYFIANLVQLLGPVDRVFSLGRNPKPNREIGSGPRAGELINVEIDTTIHALLAFTNGTHIAFGASWDVISHRHGHMELYGTGGTAILTDPNFFGGAPEIHTGEEILRPDKNWSHPLMLPNFPAKAPEHANYRAAGLADMARAILHGGEFRCSGQNALHGIEVMLAILQSAETGEPVKITTHCQKPAPLGIKEAAALLA